MSSDARDARRLEILAAAGRLVAERGYHAVRVADIAAACGTSTGTIHYHFPGKQDVLTEAVRHCVERAFDRQQAALRSVRGGRARLRLLVELQLPAPGEVHTEWLVWIQFWAEAAVRPELRRLHEDLYTRWHDTVLRLIRAGQREGDFGSFDAADAATRFTALTDGLAIQLLTGMPGLDLARMRRLLLDHLDHELGAAPARPGRSARSASRRDP